MRGIQHPLNCPYDCYRHHVLNERLQLIPMRVYRRDSETVLPCPLHRGGTYDYSRVS